VLPSAGVAAMIEVRELTKFFGAVRAVDGVSFSVARGEIVGLLGPNGSGKTTLMRILTAFFPPTSGSALIGGLDVQGESLRVRARVGYVPEHVVLYPELAVRRFLAFAADAKGVPRRKRRRAIAEVVAACGLEEMARRPIRKLSRGYRQRVAIAQALLNDPEVLILDEPTVGLDPRQAVEIRALIRGLTGRRTVLLSTHILPEVSLLCGRVIIIDRGRIVAEDSAAGLARRVEGTARTVLRVDAPRADVLATLAAVPGVDRVEPVDAAGGAGGDAIVVVSRDGDPVRRAAARAIVSRGWGLLELRPVEPSLEELFVRLLGAERKGSGDA
jgi:ABC-2 type transport system ATP-binding protein